ncbi:MAG: hypothetical protein A2817_00630 [Candidatus Yanofskybacteria bacterium RIFCSPHIGHO2_01_FULL_39_8b]|uniref:acetyl-CoA C-acyltransferase n=1 Tax=Candidatus Yanofskybacteria bacterium RIFCSPHIGHO2_01_FULL_39_8b TaxID=1802659 RepID=A0A1F8EBN9_9BACT|nr:MAG: hypothetical protein A2817_00630 [Candidatus Yanofskybacteria bacterium RIFCSPHIGHO2_01_FULL_39_8b]
MVKQRMVIVEGVRTAIGSFGGGLKDAPADMLLAICFQEVIKRTGIDPAVIDEVIAGNICQPSDSVNIARVSALRAGVPSHVPAITVGCNCFSGAEAILQAYRAYKAGDCEIVLVGGTENMSRVPYLLKQARFGQKLQHHVVTDGLWEGLVDPTINQIMGRTAENVARKWNISRRDQDDFAVASHKKAKYAKTEGKFKSQIVSVVIKKTMSVGDNISGGESIFAEDECINPDPDDQKWVQRVYSLPAMFLNEHVSEPKNPKPVFKDGKVVLHDSYANEGTVTSGNSCPMSDGAAALLLMSEEKAKEFNLEPMAYVLSYSRIGCDQEYMGEGPIYAVPKVLEKAGLKVGDIDLFELNEAFAAQAIVCQRQLGIPDEKLNIWGGAIALGHPVGATGAILTIKAMHMLEEAQKRYALITMCVGGGQGGCLIIERGSRNKKENKTKAINKIAVIGGGAMGCGIALLVSQHGRQVVIKEVIPEFAEKSLKTVHDKLNAAVARGKLMSDRANTAKGLVTATADISEIRDVDLVIEAVFENLEVKKKVFAELDRVVRPDAIFATNTSSLSITEIASATTRPERFIGMHFFNPPITMPLVELISSNMTSRETLAAADDFAKNSLGKVTIHVKECPAFLINRLLMPYLNEAAYLLTETTLTVEEIDAYARQFSWPMGPFVLLDYLGIDIAAEVAEICRRGYGKRAKPAPLMRRLVELGRFGDKSGAGFYIKDKTKGLEPLSAILGREYPNRMPLNVAEGFHRMMLGMVNEAFLCLEENISSPEEVDIGCLYGIGFPMALEGPLHWAEKEGLANILGDLKRFEQECGERFKPSRLLERYVAENKNIFKKKETDEREEW